MSLSFKHSYMVVTANFELEPVMDQFLATYPEKEFAEYQVVFKTTDEYASGEYSYIVVFKHQPSTGARPSFEDFLASYCTVNDLTAVASVRGSVLPKLEERGGRLYGRIKKNATT